MSELSLLYPDSANRKCMQLTAEAVNDLSIDYIVESIATDAYEQNSIKTILSSLTCDIDTINYRADVFEDILNFPELRDGLIKLLVKLNDLRELEKFNKDGEAAALWQMINRLREIDSYILCIKMLRDILNKIPIQSHGLTMLKERIESIYEDGGFDALKQDIDKAMTEGFSTASAEARTLGFGAGMGLPNMKRNATEFDIQSEVGVGTTITMSFALT